MEILRCPTCLSLLLDPNVKRCPACRAKLRRRSKPTVLAEAERSADPDPYDEELAGRPLPLVHQELQARIEAKTASGFMQRRRAAKAARRIAALPSTVLAGDIVLSHPDAPDPKPEPPAPGEPPEVIDLPAEAVHDVTSVAEADYVPSEPLVPVVSEPVVEAEPEPIVEPAPHAEAIVEPVVAVIVEPEPVVETEPDPAPGVPARKPRRRAAKAARIEGVLIGVEAVAEPPAPPKRTPRPAVTEAAHVAPAVAEAPAAPEPEVASPEVPEPEGPEPEVVVPEVVEAEVAPEPETPAKPAVVESVPAVNWQPSTSAWTQRVFNTSPRARQVETVQWPPRWKPADKIVDLTDDSDADQMDVSR